MVQSTRLRALLGADLFLDELQGAVLELRTVLLVRDSSSLRKEVGTTPGASYGCCGGTA